MIGKIDKGRSFYHCIRYCLEDKKELSEEQKQELSRRDKLQHKDRAEVLEYNKCFGNALELARQFKDVHKLSKRTEKPVFHLQMRLAPGDQLSKNQLTEIGRACAKEFDVADHQYICILHKDTHEQHIHLVANRVGFDGKAATDKNDYRRMAALSRRLEKEYQLTQVLSPRSFLAPKERLLPRYDRRKEKIKEDIRQTLQTATTYASFEQQMKALGYKVIKGRGISFIDPKKVKVKGSEVGFSLATIEKILNIRAQLAERQIITQQNLSTRQQGTSSYSEFLQHRQEGASSRALTEMLHQLLKPETAANSTDPELEREQLRRKRKRGQRY